jgi:hypothetical protein
LQNLEVLLVKNMSFIDSSHVNIQPLMDVLKSLCKVIQKQVPPTLKSTRILYDAILQEHLLAGQISLFVNPAKLTHKKPHDKANIRLNEIVIYFNKFEYMVQFKAYITTTMSRGALKTRKHNPRLIISIEKGRKVVQQEERVLKEFLAAVMTSYQRYLERTSSSAHLKDFVIKEWSNLKTIYNFGIRLEDVVNGIRKNHPFLCRILTEGKEEANNSLVDVAYLMDISNEDQQNLLILALIRQYPEMVCTSCLVKSPFHIEWNSSGQTTSYTQQGSSIENGSDRRKVIRKVIKEVIDIYFTADEQGAIRYLEGGAAGGELLHDVQKNMLSPCQVFGFDYFSELVISGRNSYGLQNFIAASGDKLPYANDVFDITTQVLYLAQLEDDYEAACHTIDKKSSGQSLLYNAVSEIARISKNGSIHIIADRVFHVVLVRFGFLLDTEFLPGLIVYRLDKTAIHGISPWEFTIAVKKYFQESEELKSVDMEDISFRERVEMGAEKINMSLRNLLRFYSLVFITLRAATRREIVEEYQYLSDVESLASSGGLTQRLLFAVKMLSEDVNLALNGDAESKLVVNLYKIVLESG